MAFLSLAALATLISCRGEHVDVDLEDLSTSLLQQKHRLGDCSGGYGPGQHIVQLPEIQRQFLFIVPRDHAPLAKIPAMMFFHGMYQSPFFSLRLLGLPDQLERYGWFGILPWGIPENETTSMGGQRQCCAQLCGDDLNCCLESRFVMYQDEGACGFPPEKNDLNLRFVDAIFEWMARETCIDTSKVFAGGFSYGGHFAQVLACHRSHLFQLLAPNASPDFPSEFYCESARPISYINYCGTADATSCTLRSARLGVLFAKQSRCTAQQHRRQSATVSCTEWTGCAEDHVVMDCRWEGDHDVPGRHAPDGTSVLRPASDIDWTKYIFEQFSLRVDPHQILFYGRPTPEEEEHKMAVWPPKKGTDHVYLRQALLKRGLLTLGE
mmetsp:Transcript_46554/g.110653  ORF Transcript_46554/g.110653 Transcript_46554/m.110653 type:complete len:381 (-) Transcript_46554:71-1213(-)